MPAPPPQHEATGERGPSHDRLLVVNADDFGRSEAINAGVLDGHVHGIVTSASLMVRQPAAADAAAAAREHPRLGLGLHLDLGEWERVEGEWRPTYTVVDANDRGAVTREVERQLERFRMLAGAEPSHLDSHQHVHRDEPVRSVAVAAAAALRVPLREHSWIRYCGAFYGQDSRGRSLPWAIGPDALGMVLRGLPPGTTELCCHPATLAEPFTSYAAERTIELRTLCDPAVRREVHESAIRLCSFRQLLHDQERKSPPCSRR